MRLRKIAANTLTIALLALLLIATANASAMYAEKVAVTVELVPEDAPKRAITPEGPSHISPTWKTELDFNDADWIASDSGPGGVGCDKREDYWPLISLDVTWQMQDISETCYIRIPFNLDIAPADVCDLALGMWSDDGFVAYINGVEVARRNCPVTPQWNSNATGVINERGIDDPHMIFYISQHIDALRDGMNILAIQGFNHALRSTDFLILPKLSATCLVPGRIIHVDDDATGGNNGSSWANAYNYLQDALSDANTAPKPVEIRIAQGVYKPDEAQAGRGGPAWQGRSATFRLINGVTLIGGYAGLGHSDPDARDIKLYETILSGDLLGNDVEVNSPPELAGDPSRADNSINVVAALRNDLTAILDGVTIRGGNADAGYGAGFYAEYSIPHIRYCTFADNVAEKGAAFYCRWASDPNGNLSNCTFIGNFAVDEGGAVYAEDYFDIAKCTFLDNHALARGGALATGYSSLSECFFQNNSAGSGGAVHSSGGTIINDSSFVTNIASSGGAITYTGSYSNIIIQNSFFLANHASTEGGGTISGGRFTIDNCTFVENRPRSGAAFNLSRTLSLTNSILRDQTLGQASLFTVEYSNIEGGWPGSGNIDTDPCFVDPGYWAHIADPNIRGEPNDPNASWVSGDYHLKSEAGRWDSTAGTWLRDQVTSPCVDAGDPNADYSGEPWPHGARVNMGAYGATKEASLSSNDIGAPGDLDYDGLAYRLDILSFATQWLLSDTPAYADFTRDGVVAFGDFALFAESYQRPPLPQPASNPTPADGVADVNIVAPVLTWTSDANSQWHDVYFGNQDPPPFRSRQKITTFETGTLDPNTRHYWRIDEINPAGITTGPIWSFETEGLPLRATNPSPASPTFGAARNQILSWTPGRGAASHNVHFGWYFPPPFVANQTETTFDPGPLSESTDYFWRIDEVNSKGVTTGALWIVSTRLPAANPNPPDGAVVTDPDPVLSWEGDPNAALFNVYFGTESPGTLRTSQAATTFDPGQLAHETYYWRVDHRYSPFPSLVRGNVWTFTIPHPATAINVYPPDGATEIHPDPDGMYFLEWEAGLGAESHNVYFGPTSPGDFQGNQTETKFSIGRRLAPGKYYWRIDELGTEGTVEGSVWTFTIFSPGQATDPDPPDGATGVNTSFLLSWTPGEGATSHNVYLGTESPGTFQGSYTDPIFPLPGRGMLPETKYYWRIDEVGPAGTIEGVVWSFTTETGSIR